MKVYLNKEPGEGSSNGIVASHLLSSFKTQGVTCTRKKMDSWNVCLAFVQESGKDVYARGPVVQRLDGIYLNTDTDYNKSNRDIKFTYLRAAGIIFQSDFSRQVAVKNFGEHKGQGVVIHNGTHIDDKSDSLSILNKFSPKWETKFNTYPVRLVCAARWRQSKRLSSIAKGSSVYTKAHPEACLFVLGEVEPSEQKKIREMGGNVSFVGRVTNKIVRHYYKVADVCLNLSIMDSCPNSVIEAMAHGTPCLVTKHQGVVELMQENSGYVLDVDPWDQGPISFAKMAKSIDPEIVADGIGRCVKMGRQPYRYDLSLESMARRYIKFLKAVSK